MSSRNIRCTVVKVPSGQNADRCHEELGSDLLPWADPYIAQLVQSLQESESGSIDCSAAEATGRLSSCKMEARPPFDARYIATDRFRRLRRW